jgi:FKBP-type peptidyl-prolyl cis-trans isomerase FklB
MNKYTVIIVGLGFAVFAAHAEEKLDLNQSKQRISYSIGSNIGSSFKQQDLELDPKALAAGISDAMTGKPALTEAEIRQTLEQFQTELKSKMEVKQKALGEKNIKEGESFLAENSKKDGVKTTSTGLQYKAMKTGTGKSPKATDTVKVHYHGTLIDGTVFDSSVDRGEPVTFALNEVIPGWTEALQLMKEGDKWKLFIPSKLAYGSRSASEKIGPNSALVFEVELLSIEKPK